MRIYEELFIVRPNATDEEVDPLIEQLKKLASPWTRRVEEVRASPSVEGIQHAVEIYADNRLLFLIHGSLHRIAA